MAENVDLPPEDLDAAFELLTDWRRRWAIGYLAERTGPVTVEELVDQLARGAANDPDHADRDHVAAALRHVHLPKLEAGGVISIEDDAVTLRVDVRGEDWETWPQVAQLTTVEDPEPDEAADDPSVVS